MEAMIKKLKLEVQSLKGQLLELGVAPRAPDKSLKEPMAVEEPKEPKTPTPDSRTKFLTSIPSNTSNTVTTQEETK